MPDMGLLILALCSCFADAAASAPAARHAKSGIRLITWNIHACADAPVETIVAELRILKPDLLCLQEVEVDPRAENKLDQPAAIAKDLNLNHESAGTALPSRNEQRVAILSRWKLKDAVPLDASTGRVYGLTAIVDHPDGPIRVVCIHLTCTFEAKLDHVWRTTKARLAETADLLKRQKQWTEPLLLAGDFNAVPDMAEHQALLWRLSWAATDKPTYPSHRPAIQIDRVYAFGPLTLSTPEIPVSRASDHLPGHVDVTLSPPASAPAEAR